MDNINLTWKSIAPISLVMVALFPHFCVQLTLIEVHSVKPLCRPKTKFDVEDRVEITPNNDLFANVALANFFH